MGTVLTGLFWASGLLVWVFLGATTLWPALSPWEDLVFLGAPVLLMPQLLSENEWRSKLSYLVRVLARMAILAFVALVALVLFRDVVADVWFVGLVFLTLLAGPAMAMSAYRNVRSAHAALIIEGCGMAAGVLWMVLLTADLVGVMMWAAGIGLIWMMLHSVYAIGLALRGHRHTKGLV